MKTSKLTELLSSFSNPELKKFKTFLNSPYFNSKEQFVKMLDALSAYHPDYENEKLTEEKVFKAAFPGKAYNYNVFKKSFSDIYELARTFIAIENIMSEKLAMRNYFMAGMFVRFRIRDLVYKEINITEQLFEEEIYNTEYYDQYYIFKRNISKFISANDIGDYLPHSIKEIESFFRLIQYNLVSLDLWFSIDAVMSAGNIYSGDVSMLNETASKLKIEKTPVVDVSYKLVQLLKTDNEKYYYEVMDILEREEKNFNADSKTWIFQSLEAFLVKRIRHGEEKYYRPQFELYKHCFENGIYNSDDSFAQGKLITAVESAIRIKEFDWIEEQVNKYKDRGPENIRTDYYNFNMSKILQARGDNDKALELLNKINPEISNIKTLVRNMQMKIYYELGYYELAKAQVDAYRHFIAREKDFGSAYKDSVLSFLKIYNKLIDIKAGADTGKLDDIEYELSRTEKIILKQWLTEKIEEIKKRQT